MFEVNLFINNNWERINYQFRSEWAAILKMAEWARKANTTTACITSCETGEVLYEL